MWYDHIHLSPQKAGNGMMKHLLLKAKNFQKKNWVSKIFSRRSWVAEKQTQLWLVN